MDSITRIGVVFIIYLFIVALTFFILITPVNSIFDAFDDADFAQAEDEMDDNIGWYRSAFTIAMACFLALPVAWVVSKVFSREPDYSRYRKW